LGFDSTLVMAELLTTVLVVFSWVMYGEVRSLALRASGDRLRASAP
jgi:hypothetical protein